MAEQSEDREKMDEVREIDMSKYGYCYEPRGTFRTGNPPDPNPNEKSEY